MKSKAVEQLSSEIFILNQIHSDTKKEKLHDYIWAIDNFGKIILWKPTRYEMNQCFDICLIICNV